MITKQFYLYDRFFVSSLNFIAQHKKFKKPGFQYSFIKKNLKGIK